MVYTKYNKVKPDNIFQQLGYDLEFFLSNIESEFKFDEELLSNINCNIKLNERLSNLQKDALHEFLNTILKFYDDISYKMSVDGFKGNNKINIDNLNNEYKKAILSVEGDFIRLIDKPSTALQEIAIMSNPNSLRHIKNPSKDIQVLALSLNYDTIKYIKVLDGYILNNVLAQRDDLYDFLADVLNNNYYSKQKILKKSTSYVDYFIPFDFMESSNLKILFNNVDKLLYSNNTSRDKENYLNIVKDLILNINGLSDLHLNAVKTFVYKLEDYVSRGCNTLSLDDLDYTNIKCLLTLKGDLIRFVNNPSLELQEIAIYNDLESIQYIKNLTDDIKVFALLINPDSLTYIDSISGDIIKRVHYKKGDFLNYIAKFINTWN